MVSVIFATMLSVGQFEPRGLDAREVVIEGPGSVSCKTCVGDNSPVTRLIVQLQTSPDRHARERAARTLRDVDWRRHPEVPGALAFSLLKDPARQVRFEAAESLTRMGACGPEVHQALSRAASRDPSLLTRLQARKGLRVMNHRCELACNVCDSIPRGMPIDVPLSTPEGPGEIAPIPQDLEPSIPSQIGEEPRGSIESTPREDASLEPLGPIDELKPSARPGPGLDSSVKPLRDPGSPPPAADELAPLPDPETPRSQKPQAGRTPPRPRVAVSRPLFPRLFSGSRPR